MGHWDIVDSENVIASARLAFSFSVNDKAVLSTSINSLFKKNLIVIISKLEKNDIKCYVCVD